MRSKSCVRGNLSVVEALPQIKDSVIGEVFTATAETEKSTEPLLDDPYNTWLRMQAQSLIGRVPSLEEAKQLWQYVDISTRLPFPESRRAGPLSRLLAALRAVIGMNKDQPK